MLSGFPVSICVPITLSNQMPALLQSLERTFKIFMFRFNRETSHMRKHLLNLFYPLLLKVFLGKVDIQLFTPIPELPIFIFYVS